MAASSTYTPIATTTLTSDASSISFSSIPSTYTDLVLVSNWYLSPNQGANLRFNDDTGTNYSVTNMSGTGSTTYSSRVSNNSFIYLSYNIGTSTNSSIFTPIIININNYSNNTTYKTMLSKLSNNDTGNGPGVETTVGLWRSTSAITKISLLSIPNGGGTFKSGMTATLYGITAA